MIGSKIRRIREMMGKTQNEIAKEINMTHQAYSRMERGESSISTNKLEQIAEALGVLVEDIYKFEDGNITISNNNNHGEAKENAFQLHFTVNKNNRAPRKNHQQPAGRSQVPARTTRQTDRLC
jgi:transcriptional regulator with XRE-family HTH domain